MQKQATFDSCADDPVSHASGSIPTRLLGAGAEQVAQRGGSLRSRRQQAWLSASVWSSPRR